MPQDDHGESFDTTADPCTLKEVACLSPSKEHALYAVEDYAINSSQCSIESDVPSEVPATAPQIEQAFCTNFSCCGQSLEDLHDLLQHYEECHVSVEGGDGDEPAGSSSDSSWSSASSHHSQPPTPRGVVSFPAFGPRSARVPYDDNDASVFDTRYVATGSAVNGRKRNFDQYMDGRHEETVHQALRRALFDSGIGNTSSGRHNGDYFSSKPLPSVCSDDSNPDTPCDENEHGGSRSPWSSQSNERDLPSCAPPTLFFHATTASQIQMERVKTKVPSSSESLVAGALKYSLEKGKDEKPYRCPEMGCDKAYKQLNGLKYHRLHGNCNQNILSVAQQVQRANRATNLAALSPVAPSITKPPCESKRASLLLNCPRSFRPTVPLPVPSIPTSPVTDAADLDKDKPIMCQVGTCEKRYKNLNGLRYHYHNTGSHGLLGLALLASHGGKSARIDARTGLPQVSTASLSPEDLEAVAQQAIEAQKMAQQNGDKVLTSHQAVCAAAPDLAHHALLRDLAKNRS